MARLIFVTNVSCDVFYLQHGQLKMVEFYGTWAIARSYVERNISKQILCYEINDLGGYLPIGCGTPVVLATSVFSKTGYIAIHEN